MGYPHYDSGWRGSAATSSTHTGALSHMHVPQGALPHTSHAHPHVPCASHLPHRGITHVCITCTCMRLTKNSHMHHINASFTHAHKCTCSHSPLLAALSLLIYLLTIRNGVHFCLAAPPPCLHPSSQTEHPAGWDPVLPRGHTKHVCRLDSAPVSFSPAEWSPHLGLCRPAHSHPVPYTSDSPDDAWSLATEGGRLPCLAPVPAFLHSGHSCCWA